MKQTPKEIKKAISKAGLSQASIARDLKCSTKMVFSVVHGHSVSRRIQEHISLAVGLSYTEMWGNPKTRGRPKGKKNVSYNVGN